jgi:hypothetical protein
MGDQMNLETLNVEKMKSWARENRELALTVLAKKVWAECERERVNAYILPLFKSYGFTYSGQPIENPDHLYLCEDEETIAKYYAECDRLHREHGFSGPDGHCPALVAESALIDAENELLVSAGRLAGVDGRNFSLKLDLRARVLDWAFTVCINAETMK